VQLFLVGAGGFDRRPRAPEAGVLNLIAMGSAISVSTFLPDMRGDRGARYKGKNREGHEVLFALCKLCGEGQRGGGKGKVQSTQPTFPSQNRTRVPASANDFPRLESQNSFHDLTTTSIRPGTFS